MKLYELAQNYQHVLDLITEGQDGLEDTLEALDDSIELKVENIAKVIKTLEGQAAVFKAEEERLSTRRKSLENNIKRLKTYAEDSMLAVGKKKVKGDLFTLNIQKNAPSLKLSEGALIPQEYYVAQEPELDRRTLTKHVKDGLKLDGVELVQTESIRIR